MIAWLALALAIVALALWLVVAYTLRRVWRTVGPQVAPLLSMFTPPPAELAPDAITHIPPKDPGEL